MILVVPVYASIRATSGQAKMEGQIVIDVGAEDLELGKGVIGMPGFKYTLPLEELPSNIHDEVTEAGLEWATGNATATIEGVDVKFIVGKQTTSQRMNVMDRDSVDEDLRDDLMEWLFNSLDIQYGSPMALDHGGRGVITL